MRFYHCLIWMLFLGCAFGGAGCAHRPSGNGPSLVVSPLRGGRSLGELDWTGDGQLRGDDLAAMGDALASLPEETPPPDHSWIPPTTEATVKLRWNGARLVGPAGPALSPYEVRYELEWLITQTTLALRLGGEGKGTSVTTLLRPHLDPELREELLPADVCAAIGGWDLSGLTGEGFVPSAVFDLDGTLWPGHVIDGFLGALIAEGLIRPEANAPLIEGLVEAGVAPYDALAKNSPARNAALLLTHSKSSRDGGVKGVSRKDAFFLVARILAGLTEEEVARAARCVMEEGSPDFPPWRDRFFLDSGGCGARELISALGEAGVEVVFLSATLAPLVKAAGEALGVPHKHALGSALEVVDGRYTGEVVSTYGIKASVVRQHLSHPPILVVGDSARSDFPMMLESVGMVLMVNPGSSLQKRSDQEARGRFTVLRFSEER